MAATTIFDQENILCRHRLFRSDIELVKTVPKPSGEQTKIFWRFNKEQLQNIDKQRERTLEHLYDGRPLRCDLGDGQVLEVVKFGEHAYVRVDLKKANQDVKERTLYFRKAQYEVFMEYFGDVLNAVDAANSVPLKKLSFAELKQEALGIMVELVCLHAGDTEMECVGCKENQANQLGHSCLIPMGEDGGPPISDCCEKALDTITLPEFHRSLLHSQQVKRHDIQHSNVGGLFYILKSNYKATIVETATAAILAAKVSDDDDMTIVE